MAKFDVFVGRKKELAQIEEWALKWGSTHLIAVDGDGGVGKTWLLLEVLRRYDFDERYAIVYLDAAEHPYSPWYDVRFLIEQLGEEHFPELLAGMDELSTRYFDLPLPAYRAREQSVLKTGVKEINHYLKDRRLVYLGDTLEAWERGRRGEEPLQGLGQYAAQFSNALLILAGRDMPKRMPAYLEQFVSQSTYVGLGNFTYVESSE